jgi:hypothetical protein
MEVPLRGETTMFLLNDLVQAAEDLRTLGVDATYMIVYGSHGGLEGLEVEGDFFPLWELSLPENHAALEDLDFIRIRARRLADWSVEPPKYARAASL